MDSAGQPCQLWLQDALGFDWRENLGGLPLGPLVRGSERPFLVTPTFSLPTTRAVSAGLSPGGSLHSYIRRSRCQVGTVFLGE